MSAAYFTDQYVLLIHKKNPQNREIVFPLELYLHDGEKSLEQQLNSTLYNK